MMLHYDCLLEIATMLPLVDFYIMYKALSTTSMAIVCEEEFLRVGEILLQEREKEECETQTRRFAYLDILYPIYQRQKEWRLRLRYHPISFQASFDLLSHDDAVSFLLDMEGKIDHHLWRRLFQSEALRRRRLDHHDVIREGSSLVQFKIHFYHHHMLMDIASKHFMLSLYMDLLQLRPMATTLGEMLMFLRSGDINALLEAMDESHPLYNKLATYQWNPSLVS
jgi:hypothetical protein